MYKLNKNSQNKINGVIDINNTFIPFDPANIDYANFKKEVLAGAELQDAYGNVMTYAAEYVRTLP